MEYFTFGLIKTGAMDRGRARRIQRDIFAKRLIIMRAGPVLRLQPETIEAFYAEHVGRVYWPDLRASIAGDVLPLLVYDPAGNAIERLREAMGATDPRKAAPGTIRGDHGNMAGPMADNAIHGSDSPENFHRELGIIWPGGGY
jgi:nucleoside-diphosphate kinase